LLLGAFTGDHRCHDMSTGIVVTTASAVPIFLVWDERNGRADTGFDLHAQF
jgi:hypothetical protein